MKKKEYETFCKLNQITIPKGRIRFIEAVKITGSKISIKACLSELMEIFTATSFINLKEELIDFIYICSLFLFQRGIPIGFFPRMGYIKYMIRIHVLRNMLQKLDLPFKMHYCSEGTNLEKKSKLYKIVDKALIDKRSVENAVR